MSEAADTKELEGPLLIGTGAGDCMFKVDLEMELEALPAPGRSLSLPLMASGSRGVPCVCFSEKAIKEKAIKEDLGAPLYSQLGALHVPGLESPDGARSVHQPVESQRPEPMPSHLTPPTHSLACQ